MYVTEFCVIYKSNDSNLCNISFTDIFDKSISNLTAGLFKSLFYVVLNLLMFHLMTMEQVNLSVYAPLEFLPVQWILAPGSERRRHKKPSDLNTQTLWEKVSYIEVQIPFCQHCCGGFRAEACLGLCLLLLSFCHHLSLWQWTARESVAVLNQPRGTEIPSYPNRLRNRWVLSLSVSPGRNLLFWRTEWISV